MHKLLSRRLWFFLLAMMLVTAGITLSNPHNRTETNPIVAENRKPGSSAWQSPELMASLRARWERLRQRATQAVMPELPFDWRTDLGLSSPSYFDRNTDNMWPGTRPIEGYAGKTSINKGESITLHVSTIRSTYKIEVFRIGWYGGAGASLKLTVNGLSGANYGIPSPDPVTGLIDANWPVAYTVNTDGTWQTGYYQVKFTTGAPHYETGYAVFVVRDDASTAPILFQIPTTTYQAYNNWGGKSLYDYNSPGRAYKVSYNRPYSIDQGNGYLYAGDYEMILWLEREGYNVTYATSEDTHTRPNLLDGRKIFLSNMHDEYYSWEMRANLEAWRDQGRHIAIFSSNNVYWQIRYEDSASGVPLRTIICYKDASKDPLATTVDKHKTTVLFRDPPVNRPENELLGVMYLNNFEDWLAYDHIVKNATHWVYEDTGLQENDAIPLLVGDEYDSIFDNGLTPPNIVMLSASPIPIHSAVGHMTLYVAPSGAIVFDASTNRWARFLLTTDLDDINANVHVQQITQNLLNRMLRDLPPTVLSSTPKAGATNVRTDAAITVTFNEAVNLMGGAFSLTCSPGGAQPFTQSGGPTAYTLTPNNPLPAGAECTLTVSASAVSDVDGDDPPDGMETDITIPFTVINMATCGAAKDSIPAIQGTGTSAALTGLRVVEGVVVGDFQAANKLSGFYIQQTPGDGNAETSDGIFIADPSMLLDVSVGDRVRVAGVVSEVNGQTQIAAESVTVCGTGTVTPISVTLPFTTATFAERYEGMLVTLPQTLTVTNVANLLTNGQFTLSNGRLWQPTQIANPGTAANNQQAANDLNRLVVDDASHATNVDPIPYPAGGLSASNTLRVGYTTTGTTGVLAEHSGYRFYNTAVPTFNAAGNARSATPPAIGGTLRTAAYDTGGYFNGDGAGGGFSGRGAANLNEFNRQRAKVLAAIHALNADVIAVLDVENDGEGPTSATADLVAGLNALAGSTMYAAVPDPASGVGAADSKVVLIYKTASVTPDGAALSDADGTWERYPVAQKFVTPGYAHFSVIAAQYKDRDCAGATGADADQNDGQGCYNARRAAQSARLLAFISAVQAAAGDDDVVVYAQTNAYIRETPFTALTTGGLLNKLSSVANPSTTVRNGQAGYTLQVLVNSTLNAQFGSANIWRINGDEPPALDYRLSGKSVGQQTGLYAADVYRSAADDPILAGFTLTASESQPSVASTTPANNAQNVNKDITINVFFSESVAAAPNAFSLTCNPGGARAFALSGSPANTYALDPTLPLPYGATCTVNIVGANITDVDTNDPPDTLAADYSFSFKVANAPTETVGVFRPSNNTFYLRNSNSTGAPHYIFAFGAAGDIPITGDWNGDGVESTGVYRNGRFFLKNANTAAGPVVYDILFGLPGDIPVAGDWDGDGADSIGVWRPSTREFFLKNSLTSGFQNYRVRFGLSTDLPIVGDWNGDGVDTPGVWRPSSKTFFLTNTLCSNCPASVHLSFAFGLTDDRPVIGDWDGNGTSGVGVFRPSNKTFYLRNPLSTGAPNAIFSYGLTADRPLAGAWVAAPPDEAPSFVPR
jgi:predicted extracellular nuclease